MRYALRTSVSKGLKLAIFNSCDGLGLANSLSDLGIPQIIVMREPVPDPVAQSFLRYFLKAFARREPFYLAVRQAREQLQGLEGEFPCATWLPVIFQNPVALLIQWVHQRFSRGLAIGVGSAVVGLVAMTMTIATLPLPWGLPWQSSSPTPSTPLTPPTLDDSRFSLGERVLITAQSGSEKRAGTQAFASKDYATAITKFRSYLQGDRNDPEARIYLNNARAAQHGKWLRVAVSVPIGGNLNVDQEILRGVAQAQDDVNRRGGIGGKFLQVEIANDDNEQTVAAQKIAPQLIANPSILAVIGHNASEVSLAAAPIYNQGGLVMISPTSGANELSNLGEYIFRTVPSVRVDASNLAQYALKMAKKTKFATCLDSTSPYSVSIHKEFIQSVLENGGVISKIPCDLADPSFNSDRFLSQAIADGVDGLLLTSSIERVNQGIRIAKSAKGKLALFGGSTMYMFQTLELGREDVNGMVIAVFWHPSLTRNTSFIKQAKQLWGGAVNWRTVGSYDAAQAIITGLQYQTTRNGLQKALRSPDFVAIGAASKIQFVPSGDRKREPGVGILVQVRPDSKSPVGYNFVPLK